MRTGLAAAPDGVASAARYSDESKNRHNRPRLNTIGLASRSVVTVQSNWYVVRLTDGVARGAREHKQDLLTFNCHTTEEIERSLPIYLDRCDGLLHLGFDITDEAQRLLRDSGIPLVLVGSRGPVGGVAFTDIDNVRATHDCTSHLIDLGHRRLAHFAGPENPVSREREAGFRQAHADAGVPIVGPVIAAGYTTTSGRETARRVLAVPPGERPTGIVCFNDLVALGVMAAASEMRIRIPDELSVVGVDDLIESGLSRPGLTTIRQQNVGEKAVDLLMEILAGAKPADHAMILPHELVVRGSTAAPKTA